MKNQPINEVFHIYLKVDNRRAFNGIYVKNCAGTAFNKSGLGSVLYIEGRKSTEL